MDIVPQKVLNWLHSVLLNGYRDVNRTYQDVGQALGKHPSIRPSTEIYTYDDGRSALLLRLSGMIPATFRGVTYSFPVTVWIPREYPMWPPISFVTANQGMAIRPGQHVGVEGRVYHPQLSNWHSEGSTIVGLIQLLGDIFSREPPLVARQQQEVPSSAWVSHSRSTSLQPGQPALSPPPGNIKPPALPPKPQQPIQHPSTSPIPSPPAGQNPPPRPPKGDKGVTSHSALGQSRPQSITSPRPPSQPLRSESISLGRVPWSSTWQQGQPYYHYQSSQGHQNWQSPNQAPQIDQMHQAFSQRPQNQLSSPPILENRSEYSDTQQQSYRNSTWNVQPASAQTATRQPKAEPEDLLTSPFDLPLPDPSNLPVPPVPPNPEKDAILRALSSSLDAQVQQVLQTNAAAIPSLQAQHGALMTAQANLQQEYAHLRALEAQVEANEATLHASLKEADDCIADAKRRPVPNVDETLVAPTILSNQIYMLVAEEKSCIAARQVLLQGLDKGRLGVDQWSRTSRSIAREEWLKKWLIKRAADGMGLQSSSLGSFVGEKEVAAGENDSAYYA